jgi:hypothetical protein
MSSMHAAMARMKETTAPGSTSIPYVSRIRNQRIDTSATLSWHPFDRVLVIHDRSAPNCVSVAAM